MRETPSDYLTVQYGAWSGHVPMKCVSMKGPVKKVFVRHTLVNNKPSAEDALLTVIICTPLPTFISSALKIQDVAISPIYRGRSVIAFWQDTLLVLSCAIWPPNAFELISTLLVTDSQLISDEKWISISTVSVSSMFTVDSKRMSWPGMIRVTVGAGVDQFALGTKALYSQGDMVKFGRHPFNSVEPSNPTIQSQHCQTLEINTGLGWYLWLIRVLKYAQFRQRPDEDETKNGGI